MRDFTDQLDLELRASALALPALPVRALGPAPRPIRRSLLGGVTAMAAALASTVVLVGTSSAGLPILATDATEASTVAEAGMLGSSGVDFRRAHAFGTPGGPGYVLETRSQDRICVAVPDPEAPGAYGGQCSSLARAEREGVVLELVGDLAIDPRATNLLTFVLPAEASSVRLVTPSGTTTPRLQSGVLVARITRRSTVSFTVDGERRTVSVDGPGRTRRQLCDPAVVHPTTSRAPSPPCA